MENGHSGKVGFMSDEDLLLAIDRAIEGYVGNVDVLGNAVGAAMLARRFGWKTLMLMYSLQTIKKYSKVLNIDFRAVFPEYGPLARKSTAYCGLERGGLFWRVVTGNYPGRSPEIVRDDLFRGLPTT